MEEKTLTALQGSIHKWDGIVKGYIKDEGTENCPLCALFYNYGPADIEEPHEEGSLYVCKGCPVAEATGQDECAATPYFTFCNEGSSGWAETPKAIEAAKREREFLTGLLPGRVKPEIYRESKSDNSSPVSNAEPAAMSSCFPWGSPG